MYVVAEYLFIENFLINYAILQSTKIITRTKTKKSRIFITSTISALYPFVLFFPMLSFLTNFFMKIIISIVIVKLAYNSKSLSLYLKQLSAFYVISFVFAGASIGTYYFTNSYEDILFKYNGVNHSIPMKYIFLGVILGGIMIKGIFHYYQEKVSKEKELLDTTIYLNDQKVCFTALTDTGNSLIEPISKSPVFVVEYKVIKGLLPERLKNIYDNNREEDFTALQGAIEDAGDEIILRLIPFKAVGAKNGILLGFRPDYITVTEDSYEKIYNDLLIGIFNDKLSHDDQYQGLLNVNILNGGDLSVKEN